MKFFKKTNYLAISILFLFIVILAGVLNIGSADATRGSGVSNRNCRYTHYCNYGIITKNGVKYNVIGRATYTRKCGENSFPSWGCAFVKDEIIDRLSTSTSFSVNWSMSCGNVHGFDMSIIATDGICGSATSTPVSSFPTSNLCSSGTLSGTSSTIMTYNWNCNGINGGISTSCSVPKASTFTLSCSTFPAIGTVNSNVRLSGDITGTTTPTNLFTFQWFFNGIASTTVSTSTIRYRWPQATTSAQVEVIATRGTAIQKAYCPFNRVECPVGQVSCMDVSPVESYACAAATTSCPTSACGTTSLKELDISNDYVLPAGSVLSTSSPSAGYVSSNLLCKSDNVLRFVGPTSSWKFSPSYSSWRWECAHPSAISFATCKARCATGKFYCNQTGTCVDDGTACQCPLYGAPGVFVDQTQNCLNEDGTCYGCDKVINYFKMIPDTIEKNQAARLCGGYWTTNDIAAAKRPASTTATQVVCNMKSATTSYAVTANKPTSGPAEPLYISAYALTCTQQYQTSLEPGVWKNFQEHTLDAKCRPTPSLLER